MVTMLCCGVIVLWCDWSGLQGWGCGDHAVLWGYCAVVCLEWSAGVRLW